MLAAGIYIEEDRVIHFMGDPTVMIMVSGSAAISPTCEGCGFDGMLTGVVSSCLKCFLKGGKLRRFGYGVSLAERMAAVRAGCCSMTPTHEPGLVRTRALHFLARKTFGPYHVLHNNCLHFAFYCKTGLIDECKAANHPHSTPVVVRHPLPISRVELAIAGTVAHRSNLALVLLSSTLRIAVCCFVDPGDDYDLDSDYTMEAGGDGSNGSVTTLGQPNPKVSIEEERGAGVGGETFLVPTKLHLEAPPTSSPPPSLPPNFIAFLYLYSSPLVKRNAFPMQRMLIYLF